jgi:hypothetical protein
MNENNIQKMTPALLRRVAAAIEAGSLDVTRLEWEATTLAKADYYSAVVRLSYKGSVSATACRSAGSVNLT